MIVTPPSEDEILAATERAVGRYPGLKWRWHIEEISGVEALAIHGETAPDNFGEILAEECILQMSRLRNKDNQFQYVILEFVHDMAKHLDKGLAGG